jgi:cation diffusion facilitator CzcD-associated flavoprotein CzcO
VLERLARAHLRAQVPDPRLQAALTPRFTLGCKRILLSNTYYPALTRPNVEVHATAVTGIQRRGVLGADGTVAQVDAIIFGTGFHVTNPPIAERVVGVGAQRLSDRWKGSPRGYLGTTVVGYPNLFFMLGPNLGTGHSSAFSIIEAQFEQLVATISAMRKRGWTRLEVRADVEASFNDEVQAMLQRTVYNTGGCTSYYLDENGRNSTIWPWSTGRLVRRVRRFEAAAYDAR